MLGEHVILLRVCAFFSLCFCFWFLYFLSKDHQKKVVIYFSLTTTHPHLSGSVIICDIQFVKEAFQLSFHFGEG